MDKTATDERPLKPRMRWYQFSLRTLLLLPMPIAVFLTYEINLVQGRKSELNRLYEKYAIVPTCFIAGTIGPYRVVRDGDGTLTIGWMRQWLGDQAVHDLDVPHKFSPEEIDRIATIFPEAVIWQRAE